MSYNLFLDDVRKPMFLGDTKTWEVARSYNEFVKMIQTKGLPLLISFDHDLAPEHYQLGHATNFTSFNYDFVTEKTGLHCAKWLVDYCIDKNMKLPDYQVHSMNPCGAENIRCYLAQFKKHQDNSEQFDA